MKIHSLDTLYFETKKGKKIPYSKFDLMNNIFPPNATYMINRYPNNVVTTWLKLIRDENNKIIKSEQIATSNSSYPEDLVLAMANSKDFTLGESILICSESCTRCLNSLAYKYGMNWGFPEYSKQWWECNTICSFCRHGFRSYIQQIRKFLINLYRYYIVRPFHKNEENDENNSIYRP